MSAPQADFKTMMVQDPLFVEATKDWGIYPGYLVNKVYELGLPAVRRTLAYVSALGLDRLNRKGNQNEPEAMKRYKYAMYCLKNGGVYEFKREYANSKWNAR